MYYYYLSLSLQYFSYWPAAEYLTRVPCAARSNDLINKNKNLAFIILTPSLATAARGVNIRRDNNVSFLSYYITLYVYNVYIATDYIIICGRVAINI